MFALSPCISGSSQLPVTAQEALKRLFARGEELEVPRHLLQSFFLPNICHLPLVRSANEELGCPKDRNSALPPQSYQDCLKAAVGIAVFVYCRSLDPMGFSFS